MTYANWETCRNIVLLNHDNFAAFCTSFYSFYGTFPTTEQQSVSFLGSAIRLQELYCQCFSVLGGIPKLSNYCFPNRTAILTLILH